MHPSSVTQIVSTRDCNRDEGDKPGPVREKAGRKQVWSVPLLSLTAGRVQVSRQASDVAQSGGGRLSSRRGSEGQGP